jgi:hypothetical protein
MTEDASGLGYGIGTFHFSVQVPIDGNPATVGNGTHIVFAVEQRAMVDRFYMAVLEHGGAGARRQRRRRAGVTAGLRR